MGAIATQGTNPVAFTLPAEYRPDHTVYVAVDMCGASNGRLEIQSNGVVTVQAETSFSNAQCFTSLDGASFVAASDLYTPLTLSNGWVGAPFSTVNPGTLVLGSDTIAFAGAVRTSGTNPVAFTLPASLAPGHNVYIPVDMCGATNGRLNISPSGVATIQAETSFSDAACFTSLDGATYTIWH
jgi:LDH2 family malate/lactate/ureidoglycolate dehydrogenase